MINNIMQVKANHNENFDCIIEKLVQSKVTKCLSDYIDKHDTFNKLVYSKEILTTKDVAELLGTNERSVREKINMGLIPAYKPAFTNKLLVLRTELLKEILSGVRYKSTSMLNAEIEKNFEREKYV